MSSSIRPSVFRKSSSTSKRHAPCLTAPFFTKAEQSIADLHRNFASASGFESYGTIRVDSFHQISYPNTYFGWLSIVPNGLAFGRPITTRREILGKRLFGSNSNPLEPDFLPLDLTPKNPIVDAGIGCAHDFQHGRGSIVQNVPEAWDDVREWRSRIGWLDARDPAVHRFFICPC